LSGVQEVLHSIAIFAINKKDNKKFREELTAYFLRCDTNNTEIIKKLGGGYADSKESHNSAFIFSK
jgi:hypothetical protein